MLRFGENMLWIGENASNPQGGMIKRRRFKIACASAL